MKKIGMLFAMAALLSLAACTDNTVIDDNTLTADTEAMDGEWTIRFQVSSTQTRAQDGEESADGEVQTNLEKAVTSLIAVLFTDADSGQSTSGTEDTEADDDTYFGYYTITDVSEDTPLDEDTEYTFNIGRGGQYQMVFIANPSDDLLEQIDDLSASSTVADFKALTVTDDPATKPMLMTATHFVGIIANELTTLSDITLPTIYLERIMARIDVVNQAEEVVITGIALQNRTTSSLLINDNVVTLNEDYLGDDFSVTDLTLGGATDATYQSADYAYTSEIYSYEQYASDADLLPTLVLTYYIVGAEASTFTHTVPFATTDSDGTSTPLYLKRNTYYTVNVGVDGLGSLTVSSISVVDWTEGTEFTVSGDDLLNGYDSDTSATTSVDYTDYATTSIEVGNFMMSDGTIVSAETVKEMSDEDKANVIAIVYYVEDTSDTEESASLFTRAASMDELTMADTDAATYLATLDGYTEGATMGLAMALKNAASCAEMDPSDDECVVYFSNGSEEITTMTSYYYWYNSADDSSLWECYDLNGYGNTVLLEEWAETSSYNYPFIYYITDEDEGFEASVPSPDNTTGWYLPTAMEWMLFLNTAGGTVIPDELFTKSRKATYWSTGCDPLPHAAMDETISIVGEGNYDKFVTGYTADGVSLDGVYWTSTVQGEYYAWTIFFRSVTEDVDSTGNSLIYSGSTSLTDCSVLFASTCSKKGWVVNNYFRPAIAFYQKGSTQAVVG